MGSVPAPAGKPGWPHGLQARERRTREPCPSRRGWLADADHRGPRRGRGAAPGGRRRAGVDVIALLAIAGAMMVRELLAAAVISVMLASGRALEAWAAGRARRDLQALLEHAPRFARRRDGGALVTVPLAAVGPGDLLLVASGEVVPVDGTVAGGGAVLDESALTGESLPLERVAGDPVRSGTVNAGAPFDLRATARAADSTYAGIIRLVRDAEASQPPFVRLA